MSFICGSTEKGAADQARNCDSNRCAAIQIEKKT
jgi:hypothetical protein